MDEYVVNPIREVTDLTEAYPSGSDTAERAATSTRTAHVNARRTSASVAKPTARPTLPFTRGSGGRSTLPR
jgi:hypothetical protein